MESQSTKESEMQMWMHPQKWQNDLSSFPRQLVSITVIQVYTPTTKAEEAEVDRFYEDLQHLLELSSKQKYPFHHKRL